MKFLHLQIENYLFIYIVTLVIGNVKTPQCIYATFKVPHSLLAFSLLMWFSSTLPM